MHQVSKIPESVIESAQIDGATQFQIFGKIALPLSKPLMATIALFLTFGYWNDWFLSSLFISNTNLYSFGIEFIYCAVLSPRDGLFAITSIFLCT